MKTIERIIIETNEKTRKEGDRITKLVNEDKKLTSWFAKWNVASNLFQERGKEVMRIQQTLRDKGYDVKISMQDYELSYHGLI